MGFAIHSGHRIQSTKKNEDKTCQPTNTMLEVDSLKTNICNQKASNNLEGKNIEIVGPNDPEIQEKGKEFVDYALSESQEYSELFGFPVSHLDVWLLIDALFKLAIKDREQLKLARMYDREEQIARMLKVVANWKEQGKFALSSALMAGALSGFAAGAPIVGHLWGDTIRNGLGSFSWFSSVRNMDKKEFTKMMVNLANTSSEMCKQTANIQHAYAEADRVYHETYKQIAETQAQERTRNLEELLQDLRALEQFMHRQLQLEGEAMSSVNNR